MQQALLRVVANFMKNKYNTVPQISTDQLLGKMQEAAKNNLKKQLVVVDARYEREYMVSRLPNSEHIDVMTISEEQVEQQFRKVLELAKTSPKKEVELICYCSIGFRSSVLATKMQHIIAKDQSLNYITPYNLQGAIFKWVRENKPIVDQHNNPTVSVHPKWIIFGCLFVNIYHWRFLV